MNTYKVYIRKIGDWIDDDAVGGHYVDKNYQERKIAEAKQQWKNTINCPLSIYSKLSKSKEIGLLEMVYMAEPNPYYGWKEEQLEIIIK